MAATVERMEKFLTEQNPTNTMKEREFSERRNKKKLRRREINADKILIYFRYMYILAALGLVSGSVLVLGSTVKTVSEGTFLWSQRHIFTIVGPIFIGLGVVFLLIGTGLATWRENVVKLQKQDEESMSRGSSVKSYDTVDGGGCVKKKKTSHKYKKLKHEFGSGTVHSKCNGYLKDHVSFECESISEKSDLDNLDESLPDIWVKQSDLSKSMNGHLGRSNVRQSVKDYNKSLDVCDSVNHHKRSQSVNENKRIHSVHNHPRSHSVHNHPRSHSVHNHQGSNSVHNHKGNHSVHNHPRSQSVHNHPKSHSVHNNPRSHSVHNPHRSYSVRNQEGRSCLRHLTMSDICNTSYIDNTQENNCVNQNFARINKSQKVNVPTNLNFQSGLESFQETKPPSLNSSINSNKILCQVYVE